MSDPLALAARQIGEFLTSIEPFFWRRPMTYVDVGAHRGDVFREILATDAILREAHLIEPNPSSFATLRAVAQATDMAGRITCHQFALGDRPGRLTLRDADDMTQVIGVAGTGFAETAGTFGPSGPGPSSPGLNVPHPGPRAFEVEATTLDALAESFTARRISLLKIDVEGYEAEVIAGARGLLADQAIDMIYIEAGMNPEGTQQTHFRVIEDALNAHGYRVFRVFEQKNEWPEDSPLLRRLNVAFMSPRFAAAHPLGLSAKLLKIGKENEALRQVHKTREEERRASIATQAAAAATQNKQRADLEAAAAAARAEIARLGESLSNTQRRAARTEAALAETRALAEQQAAEIETLTAARRWQDRKLRTASKVLSQIRREQAALLASTSWRVTAPLRAARELVKRSRRHRLRRRFGKAARARLQPAVWFLRRRRTALEKAGHGLRARLKPVAKRLGWRWAFEDAQLIETSGLFDGAWYLAEYPDVTKTGIPPLDHFLKKGWREGRNPSAGFDTIDYLKSYPAVARARVNPLLDYLREGRRRGRIAREPLSQQARAARAIYDPAASEAWIAGLRAHPAFARSQAAPPLVTIIVPSRDRITLLPHAIDSILAQSYQHWELIIVDDGSTDGTADTVRATYPDSRLRVIRTAGLGVSGARNAGLAEAQGALVAYLDSDNIWVPDYLELMVAEFERSGAANVYAVLKVREEKSQAKTTEIWYRATPFDYRQLEFANYIDLNIFMHRLDMYQRFGGFDTGLRRAVDWDLILRYVRHDPVSFANFVGAEYDHSDRGDRLTVRELPSFKNVVRNKHWVDWDLETRRLAQRDPDLISVVICLRGPMEMDEEPLRALYTHQAGQAFELVLVDNGADAVTKALIADWQAREPGVHIVDARENVHFSLANNVGFAASSGGTVVFLNETVRVSPEWLRPLARALKDESVLGAQPKVLNPDGTIHSVGFVFGARSPIPYPLYAGEPGALEATNRPRAVAAVGVSCAAFRAADFVRLRGFNPLFSSDGGEIDFCLRLGGGAPVFRLVSDALVVQHPPHLRMRIGRIETDRREFASLWRDRVPADDAGHYARDGMIPGAYRPDQAAWVEAGLARWRPEQLAEAAPRPPASSRSDPRRILDNRTIALKIGCPRPDIKDHWGDYHFAVALAAAFLRRGVTARIDFVADADRHARPSDLNLVLRGRQRYATSSSALNLMWLISHPDRVSAEELRGFDHVFIASQVWTDRVAAMPGVRCQTLLQCTDSSRFHPGLYDPLLRSPALFVANSRKVLRHVVREAVEQDLPIDIYGEMWEGLAPAEWVKAETIANVDLPRYYASADVVLNDHWDSMRENGFVSNRVFDVLATGAPLVTDRIVGLPDEIAVACHFFGEGITLTEAVAAARRARAETYELSPPARATAEMVCRDHSFDARADEILSVIASLDARGRR